MAISNIIAPKFYEFLSEASSVMEIGNQVFENGSSVKKHVESVGKKHVSIDITGGDGSLQIDLSKVVDSDLGQFSLVTNFGTTEHIDDSQFNAFKNIHNFCEKGGVMIHEVPHVGFWPGHCRYYYDAPFFEYLAEKNDYKIKLVEMIDYPGNGNLIFVALIKTTNKPFLCKETEFDKKIHLSKADIVINEYWKNYL